MRRRSLVRVLSMETLADKLVQLLSRSDTIGFLTAVDEALREGASVDAIAISLIGASDLDWPHALSGRGLNPNYKDDEGNTLLSMCVHTWCFRGSTAQVGRVAWQNMLSFLDLGADPNSSYLGLYSILRFSICSDARELAALLLASGADVDRIEPEGRETLRDFIMSSELMWTQQLLRIYDRSSADRG